MAFAKVEVDNKSWKQLGTGSTTTISFQNSGQNFLYINATATSSPPTETVGLMYSSLTGELKKTVADMNAAGNAAYVWARAASSNTDVIYETA